MIARHWRGWTTLAHANAYEEFLRTRIFPGLQRIDGYRGGYLLRQDRGSEAEFIVLNLFESLDAVRRFAGTNYATAVIEPEAKRLLTRWDATAEHYEVPLKIKEEAAG